MLINMLLHPLLIAVVIGSVTSYGVADDEYFDFDSYNTDELVWADRYMVKATKLSLTSNLEEDFTAWKTNVSSRVDFNKGAVKVITILSEDKGEDYLNKQYDIRPVTTEKVLNKIMCTKRLGKDEDVHLDDILPEITEEQRFEPIGNETIDGLETIKFEFHEITNEKETRLTVWAYYDDMGMGEYGWIPVRYEVKKYSAMLGSLLRHEIWKYFDFDQDFDDPFVFNIELCEEEVNHSWNSDKVTKDLMFIDPENERHVDHVFNSFKIKFERKYAHEIEHNMRKIIFQENMRLVRSVNRANLGYTLGINQFSDQTPEELKGSLGVLSPPPDLKGTERFPYDESLLNLLVSELPAEYDARLEGLVTPVKNQESCGSCWTFATVAVLEGALAKVNGGRTLSLSNQAILDCAYDGLIEVDAGGCNGGYDYIAYDWIMKHGIPTVEDYGLYKNREGYCHIANVTKTYAMRGYTEVTPFSNNAMKVALVNHGPLFIYINTRKHFHAYSEGIFYQDEKSCPPDQPTHAVALVGYGERDGEPFWVLKNSWGTTWGIDGYMLISARDSVCGVSFRPSYPVV